MTNFDLYKLKAQDEYNRLIHMLEFEQPGITSQIRVVDNLLLHLRVRYNYIPDYVPAFDRIVDALILVMSGGVPLDDMRIKPVKPRFEFCKN